MRYSARHFCLQLEQVVENLRSQPCFEFVLPGACVSHFLEIDSHRVSLKQRFG